MPEPVKEQITQAIQEDQGKVPTGVAIGGAALAAALAIGGGYAATHQETTPPPPTPISASATPKTPDVISTPSGSFKVEVSPTASPETTKSTEAPKTPCNIVPDQFCDNAELVTYKGIKYVGLMLPAGTSISSLIDGQYTKANINQPTPPPDTNQQPPPFQGLLVGINPPDHSISYNFTGDISLTGDFNVQKSKAFAVVGNTGAREFGQYNLAFTITRIDPSTGKPVVDETTLRMLFPKAFEKPPKEFSYAGPINPTVTTPEYYNKP